MGRLLLILGLLVAFAAPLQASEAYSQELPPVLISPRRMPGLDVDASEFPGSTTVITRQEIQESHATSLPELLNRQVGVTSLDTHGFGLGADSSVNLRGVVNGSRTGALVLVNGVRQNRVTGDEVHWQSLPLEDIERIEIIRGGSSLIYGEGALSGVINITTKKGADKPFTSESGAEAGTFGRFRYFSSIRGGKGPVTYGTSFQRREVSGYRENTNSRTSSATAHIGVDVSPELHLETNVLTSEDTSYFPGGITPAQSEARRRQRGSFNGLIEEHMTQAGLDALWRGPDGLSVAVNAFVRDRETDSAAPSRLATIAPSSGLSVRSGHDAPLSADLRSTLVTGIDLLDEKASTGFRTGAYSESNKGSYGLFVEETLRFYDRASLVGGLRYDRSRFDEAISFPAYEGTLRFEGWSPKLGASIDIAKPVSAYVNFSRPYKAPNVDDFSVFVPSIGGFTFVGNIDLIPQQGNEYETGLRLKDPRIGKATAALFYSQIDDEILFNALTFQNQNFDTRRTGLELSVEPALPIPNLSAQATYTFMEAEFHKGAFKGNALPGVPEHEFGASLAYEFIPGLRASLDWQLFQDGFRINDFANGNEMDNYGALNAGLRYTYRNITAYFTIENVTDEEYTTYQSSNGTTISTGENPAPPRSYLAGVSVAF